MKSPRILVVDDNVDLAENVAEALELAGARTELAASGREALARLAANPPYDLVLTDMRMPDVSGLELIRALRARDPATPVIVMTAYTRGADLDEARERGALEVLEKPIDLGAVMALVERLRDPVRVLVVEDDAMLRANLTEALFGLERVLPLSAGTASEARRVTERVCPRLVVLDLRLPDERGLSLLDDLRAEKDFEVIVTTGFPSEVTGELGDAEVLVKPFAIPTLLHRIKALS
ncbi:MAG: response regulator [Sandaracinaceae bacterium]|nr:response regulator [Sandaracinaceae bacterium]